MECRSRGCEEEASKEREALVEMKKRKVGRRVKEAEAEKLRRKRGLEFLRGRKEGREMKKEEASSK